MRTIDVRKGDDVAPAEALIYVTDILKMIEALSALHIFIQQENHQ